MIIDCHGHYTTAPAELEAFRATQLAGDPSALPPHFSDDQLRETLEPNHLRLMRERGLDHMILSPKASAMQHHDPNPDYAETWARTCNDLIHRTIGLFPSSFSGACQLPQTPDGALGGCIRELRRCVEELGFIGCNLNPDPSGGRWLSPALTERFWYPLYEVLVELDVPVMIHPSSSCVPAVHSLGAHYLNSDTTVFMQLVQGNLFADFPDLRIIIPHGGGSAPYHWGRYQGLAARLGQPELRAHLLDNVYFDSCVYHQPGIDLLLSVTGYRNVLFASEMLGAVRGVNPDTGRAWDDTRVYLDASSLPAEELAMVFAGNARRVYPRLSISSSAPATTVASPPSPSA